MRSGLLGSAVGSPIKARTWNLQKITGRDRRPALRRADDTDDATTTAEFSVRGVLEKLTHPVIWPQTSFHYIPRDENEPIVNEHWQGFFTLLPRDLTANNELARR